MSCFHRIWARHIAVVAAIGLFLLLPGCPRGDNTDTDEPQAPAPSDTTIFGKVFSAVDEAPLAEVVVTVANVTGQVQTDAQGRFAFPVPGAGTWHVTAEREGYTYAQRRAVVAEREMASVSEMYLTPLDPRTMSFGPGGGSDANSDDSIRVSVPAGALRETAGLRATNFQRGKHLPNYLPTLTHFTYACELTPNGQAFDQPVTIRMRNTRGFAPGTPIPVGVYDPVTLEWTHESMGVVSSDGEWAEFQVSHFSPRDCNLGRMSPAGSGEPGEAEDMSAGLGTRRRNHPCSTVRGGSQIGVADGHLSIDHVLPGHWVLGSQQTVVLRYNSPVSTNPVLGLTYDISQTSITMPARLRFVAEIAGQRVEQTYTPIEGPMSFTWRWDGRDGMGNALPAGTYSYRLTLVNEYSTTFATVPEFGAAALASTGVAADEYLELPSTFTGSILYTPAGEAPATDNGWGILGLHRLAQTGNTVVIRDGGGSSFTFTGSGSGGWQASRGDFSSLIYSSSGRTWTWTLPDRTRVTFNAKGLQTRCADRNNNATTYTYDSASRLTSITDPMGKVTALTYDAAGRLSRITDPTDRVTQFAFDTSGDLVTITNPDTTTRRFGYDQAHRMTSQTDAGEHVTRYTYNTAGEVTRVDHPDGTYTSFGTGVATGSGPGPSPVSGPTYTDGAGGTWTFGVDAYGTRTSIIDPLGRFLGMGRNASDQINSLSRPDGSRWFFEYDSQGNCTTVTPARRAGSTYGDGRIELAYDLDLNLPETITSNLLGTWEYTYDTRGNVTQAQMPTGSTATFGYNSRGQMTWQRIGGATTTFTYDADGNLATAAGPEGHAWHFGYDNYGNITEIRDPMSRQVTATYDAMNLMTSLARGMDIPMTFAYMPARGTADLNGHEPAAVLTRVTDGRGNATQFTYDSMYRLTRIRDGRGKATDFTYDGAGRLLSRRDAAGNVVSLTYNTAGQLTRKQLNTSETIDCTYDAQTGLLTRATGNTCRYDYEYDEFGRLSRVTTRFLPSGRTCSVSYTPRVSNYFESLVTLESGSSNRVFGWEYDGEHGPLAVQRFGGTTFNEYFEFDSADRRTGWWNSWMTLTNTFDTHGRQTGVTLDDGSGTTFEAAWSHDNSGRISQMTAPDGAHQYSYDTAGRLITAAHPTVDNPDESYTYDNAGNRRVAGLEAQFVYDAANRLTEDPTYLYTYDDAGNLTRRTHKVSHGVTAFTYDAEHRLTAIGMPDGSEMTYAYDPLGRLVERRDDGIVTRLVYDGDEVFAEFNGANLAGTFVSGTRLDHPEGVMRGGFGATTDYYYLKDPNGTILAAADDTGSISGATRMQAFGKPVTAPATNRLLAGLYYDARAGLYYVRQRFYDPVTGRFLQRDPIPLLSAIDPYSYAGNDPVNSRDPFGLNPEGAEGGESGSWRAESAAFDHIIKPEIFYTGDQIIEAGTDALEMALIDNGRGTSVGGARAVFGFLTPSVGRGLGTAWSFYAETHEILNIAFSNCPTQAAVDWYSGQWWSPGRRTVNRFLTLGGHMR